MTRLPRRLHDIRSDWSERQGRHDSTVCKNETHHHSRIEERSFVLDGLYL